MDGLFTYPVDGLLVRCTLVCVQVDTGGKVNKPLDLYTVSWTHVTNVVEVGGARNKFTAAVGSVRETFNIFKNPFY